MLYFFSAGFVRLTSVLTKSPVLTLAPYRIGVKPGAIHKEVQIPNRTVALRIQPPAAAQLARWTSAGTGNDRFAGVLAERLRAASSARTCSRTIIRSGPTNGVGSAFVRRSGGRPCVVRAMPNLLADEAVVVLRRR